jgi:Histidine kinase-like ATPase domain
LPFIETMTHTLALLPGTSRSRPFVELQQSLPSQVSAIEPFVWQLMRFISKFRSPDGSETDIELALHEALANAVIHGNGEDPYKRVYVVCRCDMDGEVSITIRDQGQGSTAAPYQIRPLLKIRCPVTGAESTSCKPSWTKSISTKVV